MTRGQDINGFRNEGSIDLNNAAFRRTRGHSKDTFRQIQVISEYQARATHDQHMRGLLSAEAAAARMAPSL